jgi:hypothetical protein
MASSEPPERGPRAQPVRGRVAEVELVAVEGLGWLIGDLERRLQGPCSLLRAIRLTETEPRP